MALEELKARISLLLEEMVNQPEDQHEIQEQLREKLQEMRAMGLPLIIRPESGSGFASPKPGKCLGQARTPCFCKPLT